MLPIVFACFACRTVVGREPNHCTKAIGIENERRPTQQNIVVGIFVVFRVCICICTAHTTIASFSFSALIGMIVIAIVFAAPCAIVIAIASCAIAIDIVGFPTNDWQKAPRVHQYHPNNLVSHQLVESFDDERGLAKGHVLVGVLVGNPGLHSRWWNRVPLARDTKAVDEGVCPTERNIADIVVAAVAVAVVVSPFSPALEGMPSFVVALAAKFFSVLHERIHDIVDNGPNGLMAARRPRNIVVVVILVMVFVIVIVITIVLVLVLVARTTTIAFLFLHQNTTGR